MNRYVSSACQIYYTRSIILTMLTNRWITVSKIHTKRLVLKFGKRHSCWSTSNKNVAVQGNMKDNVHTSIVYNLGLHENIIL